MDKFMMHMKDTTKFDLMIALLFFGVFVTVYLDMPYRLIGILIIMADFGAMIFTVSKKYQNKTEE